MGSPARTAGVFSVRGGLGGEAVDVGAGGQAGDFFVHVGDGEGYLGGEGEGGGDAVLG